MLEILNKDGKRAMIIEDDGTIKIFEGKVEKKEEKKEDEESTDTEGA